MFSFVKKEKEGSRESFEWAEKERAEEELRES